MHPLLRKLLRLPLLLAPLLVLSNCSFTGLAYNHLDLLARYFLSDYVDLTPTQRKDFDPRFDAVWHWHRATQMPLYAATAHALADQAGRPQTEQQVRATLESIDKFAEPVVRRILHEGAPLLAELSDGQVEHALAVIDRKIDKESQRAERDNDADWHRQEFKESRSSFEKYAGHLTSAQEKRIREYTDAAVRDPELYHRAALAARRQFAQLLAQRHAPDFDARLQTLLDPDFEESDKIEKLQSESRNRFVLLLVDLGRTYSPEQQRHFHDKIEELADEFDALAKDPSAGM